VELTIVVPCINEAGTLAACDRKARSCLDRLWVIGAIHFEFSEGCLDSRTFFKRFF
jgi:hypothetical protein